MHDCRMRGLSPFKVEYYRSQLAALEIFCTARGAGLSQVSRDRAFEVVERRSIWIKSEIYQFPAFIA